jgi:hypothetical protein
MAPSPTGARPRFLIPLFSAALSALVVVGVYEVRARLGRSAAPTPDGGELTVGAPADRASGGVPTALGCGDLRRRYLMQCSSDLPVAGPAEKVPPPHFGASPGPDPRAAAELSAWLNPSPDELEEMARRCELRFEMPAITENQPPVVTDEQAAALSLSTRERELIERTLRNLHTELRGFAQRAVAEVPAPSGDASTSTLEEMLSELQTRPGGGFEEARERLAKERAASATPIGPNAQQPPGERLLRTWATLGDQFERHLATELGSDRARQLRSSPQAGWMNRFSQSGCRSEPSPSSKVTGRD